MLRTSALLISVGSASAASPQEKWADFIAKFGKTYTTPAEEARRFEVFKDNVDLIDAENAKDHTYELAINRFADLTLKEFSAQYMGSKPPAQIFGDLPYLGNHTWTGEALPASVDWRSKGAVTPVKNQGQCGSCWSFGTTGGLEGAWKIATGNLVPISEQMFVDCDHTDNGCGGGLPSNAYKFATTHDLCTESSYPYQGVNGRCDMSRCEVAIPHGKVTGYKSLAHIQRLWPASEAAMMSAVAQQPVSVGIEADKEMFQFYKGGVLDGSCGASIDHAVLCVGYGTDPTAGDYWLIKNSWGVDHGEEGYWRLKRGKKYAWSDECGVLMMPSYPVIATDFVVV